MNAPFETEPDGCLFRRSHMTRSGIGVLCFAAWLLMGCAASEYMVAIRSISQPASSTGTNYTLLPGNKNIASDDEQFGELAVYVRRTLSELQYREAETPGSADIVVLLGYGLDTSKIDLDRLALPTPYMPDGALPIR